MTDYKLVPVEATPEMVEAAREHHEGEAYLPVSLYKAMLAAAPAVQGEPVYLYRRLGLHDFVTCNHDRYAELSVKPHLFETKVLYTAPQPAGQQPAPDVAGLVEALEQCITSMLDSGYRANAVVIRAARSALAAHRKGGEV